MTQASRNLEQTRELLLVEHADLQAAIDKFDEQRVQLKSWMMAIVAGLSALAVNSGNSAILWVALLTVLFIALAEFSLIDIQEDAIKRNKKVEKWLNDLSRGEEEKILSSYKFGLTKVFGAGRRIRPSQMWHWMGYRTFNPYLYGGLVLALSVMLAIDVI